MAEAVHARKQASSQADWLRAIETVPERISYDEYAAVRDAAIAEVREQATPNMAYGWSGGKDSQAIRCVAEGAGITNSVLVICQLEYPAFVQWAQDHAPAGLSVEVVERDLAWLADRPGLLFPKDATTAAKWFRLVQHTGQARYYKRHGLDAILLGRRRQDGNFVGRGTNRYTSKGITRWSPIASWSHDMVLACLHYEGYPLPPMYDWPRGFVVGTGPWPARQGTSSEDHGWDEVWSIDRTVVYGAAELLPGAARCIERNT